MNQELSRLKEENDKLKRQLLDITSSRSYKLGIIARLALRDPKRAAKKSIDLALKSPRGLLGRMQGAANKIIDYQASSFDLDIEYQKWISLNDPTPDELVAQERAIENFRRKPVISIITPVFRPPVTVLEELIQSVLQQSYPYFELCLGEFAQDIESQKIIKRYAKADKRIKYKFYKVNKGISANSNECIKLANGEYLALLDHDDLITPNALYENVKMLNEQDYDFLYSDKDKITADGKRYEPLFKPDWSPEIMFNANYLTHFNVFKRSLVEEVGGWESSTDGAQDWDLFLKLVSISKRVGHVSKVLYHWRVIETSTAHSIAAKPYALEGQKNAIERYARKLRLGIDITHDDRGVLNLRWVKSSSRVARIIVIADELSAKTITKSESLASKLSIPVELVLSRNTDDFMSIIKSSKRNKECVLLVDSRLIDQVEKDDIEQLIGWLDIPLVAFASPHIVSSDGVIIDAGRLFGYGCAFGPLFAGTSYVPHITGYKEWIRNVSAASPYFCVLDTAKLSKKSVSINSKDVSSYIDAFWYIAVVSRIEALRTVSTPYVQILSRDNITLAEPQPARIVSNLLAQSFEDGDDYFNVHLSVKHLGPHLATNQEPIRSQALLENYLKAPITSIDIRQEPEEFAKISDLQRDSLILSATYSFTESDLKNSSKITSSSIKIPSINTAVWIVPEFSTMYAGLKNIFALANRLASKENAHNIFVFQNGVSRNSLKNMKRIITSTFPTLKGSKFMVLDDRGESIIPESDIAVCTLWTTAYNLLKYQNTKSKCYIIQDWETSFYPKGTISALCEATYRFGFIGLTGTRALAQMYENFHKGNRAHVVPSLLDLNLYLNHKSTKEDGPADHKRVMFYGRPDSPRNAFELGVNALTELKKRMGDDVEVVVAGSTFDADTFNFSARDIKLAGKVPYDRLAEFYGSFDACLFLMYSEHPGVVPLEMMASGVPVVINTNSNSEWDVLYRDKITCLTALSSVADICDKLELVLKDNELRAKLINKGKILASKYTEDYYNELSARAIKSLKNGE